MWQPLDDDKQPWIEFAFSQPQAINVVRLDETMACGGDYVVSALTDGAWQKIAQGKLATTNIINFDRVTTSCIKVSFENTTKTLGIRDARFYNSLVK